MARSALFQIVNSRIILLLLLLLLLLIGAELYYALLLEGERGVNTMPLLLLQRRVVEREHGPIERVKRAGID